MSALPAIVSHPLAVSGTLAGDWLRGSAAARALLPQPRAPTAPIPHAGNGGNGGRRTGSGSTPVPSPSEELTVDAFGASSDEAAEKLRRILSGEGYLVTTGQQPLLLLGPLFVLYKALGAVEAAHRLEAETGLPCLGCFWIASDDHDWDEVGVVRVLDPRNELRTFRLLPPEGWNRRPAGPAPLSGQVSDLISQVRQALPNSEFVPDLINQFRDAWRPGVSLADAFAVGLSGVLAGRQMIWLDAGSRAVKRAAVPLLRWSLEHSDAFESQLERGAGRIRQAGYEPPIAVLSGATPVFLDTGISRERLYRDGDRILVGRDGEAAALQAVLRRLQEEPEAFSPNVSLRPVMESWLLPVAATVLGPGELGYWSQLGDVFGSAGVRRPRILPRPGWVLVETKVEKVLSRLDATPAELADGGDTLSRKAVESTRPAAVTAALQELRGALDRGLEQVERRVSRELPGIRSAVGKARAELFRAVEELESRVDARVGERQEVLLAQIRKAALHLFPDGRPQERVLSPLYHLARYGSALVDGLADRTREAWRPDDLSAPSEEK